MNSLSIDVDEWRLIKVKSQVKNQRINFTIILMKKQSQINKMTLFAPWEDALFWLKISWKLWEADRVWALEISSQTTLSTLKG